MQDFLGLAIQAIRGTIDEFEVASVYGSALSLA
jgi:hypothetical protein